MDDLFKKGIRNECFRIILKIREVLAKLRVFLFKFKLEN
jgi:hypothetical protein